MKKLNFVILPTIENSKNYIAVNQVFDSNTNRTKVGCKHYCGK